MKIEFKIPEKTDTSEVDFPKPMAGFHGLIVLFFSPESGVVVEDKSNFYDLGHFSAGWDMDNFTDMSGDTTITFTQ